MHPSNVRQPPETDTGWVSGLPWLHYIKWYRLLASHLYRQSANFEGWHVCRLPYVFEVVAGRNQLRTGSMLRSWNFPCEWWDMFHLSWVHLTKSWLAIMWYRLLRQQPKDLKGRPMHWLSAQLLPVERSKELLDNGLWKEWASYLLRCMLSVPRVRSGITRRLLLCPSGMLEKPQNPKTP